MNSSTTRILASVFLAIATGLATAQTPAQPQAAPQQPASQQQATPQPQAAPQQNAPPQQPSTAQPQTSAQQNISSEGQALHILVGKSVVVNVQAPITRVLSSNPALLEVKFAEVDRTKFAQFGVNLLSTGAGNTLGTTTTGQFGGFGPQHITDIAGPGTHSGTFTTDQTLNNVLNIFLFRFDIHFGAVIQDLEQKSVLQILAEPNLMALNGQKATFLAGGEFPFPLVQPGNGFTAVTIQFKPFGVKLDFTGNMSNDGTIRLHVAPEVSTLDFTNALAIQGFTVPAISTRRAETDIELKDGQSFGIAGLLDNRAQAQLNKIPGIGDIPVLGQLFRSRNINKSKTELLVLVTPHIIDPVHTTTPPPANPNLSVPFLDKPKFDEPMPGHDKTESAPSPAPSAK